MEYKVAENLMRIKLQNFISEYKNASKLFENTDVKNKLLHPGEYGIYKENLVAKLFTYTLPQKYACGTGFVTNAKKEITTQCDIILYDKMNAPFLEVDPINRFFQQEVIYGIGEIKSCLSKQQLFEALLKMANNKKIRTEFRGISPNYESYDVSPKSNAYDSICTFLICDKVEGWSMDIGAEIQQMYEQYNVEVPYRFNLILSLENGVISYDAYKIIQEVKQNEGVLDESFEENGGHFCFATPFFGSADKEKILALDFIVSEYVDGVENLKHFLVVLNNFLIHLKSYYPDPSEYF